MRLAIASSGKTLDDPVDARFGRSNYFLIGNADEEEGWEAVENMQNLQAAQGAGIQAAQNVVDHNAEAVLAGNLGPKAFQVLQAADITVFLAENMSAREAISAFREGALQEQKAANVQGHWM